MTEKMGHLYAHMSAEQRFALLATRSGEMSKLPTRHERKTAKKRLSPLAIECAIDSQYLSFRKKTSMVTAVKPFRVRTRAQVEIIKAIVLHPIQVIFERSK